MSKIDTHTILIIDDDTDDVELFCETLAGINGGIGCLSAGNGQEGLLLLKKTELLPDLIFLDLNMPRMNGKQCLKELKANERFREIPVIIYTTSRIKDDMRETMQLGASGFITKPFRTADIRKAVIKILEKYQWVSGFILPLSFSFLSLLSPHYSCP